MTDDNIATSTTEVAESYDPNPNETQLIADSLNRPDAVVDDMPWLLRDKFKGESLDDVIRQQAMAYPELQSKMGAWWGAPKDGNYDTSGLSEHGVTAEDPIFTNMTATFKEMGLSNAAVKKLAESYDQSLKSMVQQQEQKLASEMTPELAQAAQRVEGTLKKFKKDEQERIKTWLQDKDDFQLFNTLIAMNPTMGNSNSVPSQTANYGFRFETSYDVEQEKMTDRYRKDQVYRDQVSQRYRDALTRERKG